MPTPVLVAMKFSAASDEALRQAHAVSTSSGAPLVVCHILPEAFRVRVLFPQDAGIDTRVQATLDEKAGDAARSHVTEVLGPAASRAAIAIESGTAHAGILEIAARAGAHLVVMGPGPTALRVARSSHCPVLIARPSPADGPVVGATDFSDPALPAIRAAAIEASRRGAPLRVVHCLDLDETEVMAAASMAGVAGAYPMPVISDSTLRAFETTAHERLADALCLADASGEAVVLRRSARAGIVETATQGKAALVVVGSRGRTGLSRLLLGSVAEHVIDHAPCSVMVVPLHPDEQDVPGGDASSPAQGDTAAR
jgi:nucleotide-binding universal stress UspA family protein